MLIYLVEFLLELEKDQMVDENLDSLKILELVLVLLQLAKDLMFLQIKFLIMYIYLININTNNNIDKIGNIYYIPSVSRVFDALLFKVLQSIFGSKL